MCTCKNLPEKVKVLVEALNNKYSQYVVKAEPVLISNTSEFLESNVINGDDNSNFYIGTMIINTKGSALTFWGDALFKYEVNEPYFYEENLIFSYVTDGGFPQGLLFVGHLVTVRPN